MYKYVSCKEKFELVSPRDSLSPRFSRLKQLPYRKSCSNIGVFTHSRPLICKRLMMESQADVLDQPFTTPQVLVRTASSNIISTRSSSKTDLDSKSSVSSNSTDQSKSSKMAVVNGLQANPDSIAFLQSLDFSSASFCMEDNLHIYSVKSGMKLGDFKISVSKTETGLEINGVCEGTVEGVHCGTTLKSEVNTNTVALETVYQEHSEFLEFQDIKLLKKTLIPPMQDPSKGRVIIQSETTPHCTKERSHSLLANQLRGFLSEGASLVLLKVLANQDHVPDLNLITLDGNGVPCSVRWLSPVTRLENRFGQTLPVVKITREITTFGGTTETWRFTLLKTGQLISWEQVDAAVYMKATCIIPGTPVKSANEVLTNGEPNELPHEHSPSDEHSLPAEQVQQLDQEESADNGSITPVSADETPVTDQNAQEDTPDEILENGKIAVAELDKIQAGGENTPTQLSAEADQNDSMQTEEAKEYFLTAMPNGTISPTEQASNNKMESGDAGKKTAVEAPDTGKTFIESSSYNQNDKPETQQNDDLLPFEESSGDQDEPNGDEPSQPLLRGDTPLIVEPVSEVKDSKTPFQLIQDSASTMVSGIMKNAIDVVSTGKLVPQHIKDIGKASYHGITTGAVVNKPFEQAQSTVTPIFYDINDKLRNATQSPPFEINWLFSGEDTFAIGSAGPAYDTAVEVVDKALVDAQMHLIEEEPPENQEVEVVDDIEANMAWLYEIQTDHYDESEKQPYKPESLSDQCERQPDETEDNSKQQENQSDEEFRNNLTETAVNDQEEHSKPLQQDIQPVPQEPFLTVTKKGSMKKYLAKSNTIGVLMAEDEDQETELDMDWLFAVSDESQHTASSQSVAEPLQLADQEQSGEQMSVSFSDNIESTSVQQARNSSDEKQANVFNQFTEEKTTVFPLEATKFVWSQEQDRYVHDMTSKPTSDSEDSADQEDKPAPSTGDSSLSSKELKDLFTARVPVDLPFSEVGEMFSLPEEVHHVSDVSRAPNNVEAVSPEIQPRAMISQAQKSDDEGLGTGGSSRSSAQNNRRSNYDPTLSYTRYQQMKASVEADSQEYLAEHPELKLIISDLINCILLAKPEDIPRFANSYFHFMSANDN